MVIYDSRTTPDERQAVEIEATATEPEGEVPRLGLSAFSRESLSQGLTEWPRERVTGPADSRLFQATATESFILADGPTSASTTAAIPASSQGGHGASGLPSRSSTEPMSSCRSPRCELTILRHVPIRHRDTVQYLGPGPPPTEESWSRHDPVGEPQPGDYGEVLEAREGVARVAWRFGATTETPIGYLVKTPKRVPSHRYRVTFEQGVGMDAVYTIVTGGGEAKAVYLAAAELQAQHPDFRAWSVEVADLGTDFVLDPENDIIAWDEQ